MRSFLRPIFATLLFLSACLSDIAIASSPTTYLRYCASCHGERGDGEGVSARWFELPATHFTAGVYKCRSTNAGMTPTDGDLRASLRRGLGGTSMPSFIALGPLEVENVVRSLKAFSSKFAQPSTPLNVPPEPKDDGASVGRGRQLYGQLHCNNCHGADGRGGPAASTLKNDDGTPSRVTTISGQAALKCGDSPARIYTTLLTGLDGTPMASYADTLAPEQAWDLTHFVVSLRSGAK